MTESIEIELTRITERLDAIAEHNQDSFEYCISIQPSRPRRRFYFEARESADSHVILDACAPTLTGILEQLNDGRIEGMKETFGYEMP